MPHVDNLKIFLVKLYEYNLSIRYHLQLKSCSLKKAFLFSISSGVKVFLKSKISNVYSTLHHIKIVPMTKKHHLHNDIFSFITF